MFKRQRKLLVGDIVIPTFKNASYSHGMITRIERNYFKVTRVVVRYNEKEDWTSFTGEEQKEVSTYEDSYPSTRNLKLYEPEYQLIRPLEEGDTIFLLEDFFVFYSNAKLYCEGKSRRIVDISYYESNPYQKLYSSGQFNFILANIDIPKTNRELMRKYSPKVTRGLPSL